MPSPTFKTRYVDWDAEALLDKAGGPSALVRLLEKHQYPTPMLDTVYMWRSRNRIPHRWIPTILYVLLREKLITLSEVFVLRRQPPPGSTEDAA